MILYCPTSFSFYNGRCYKVTQPIFPRKFPGRTSNNPCERRHAKPGLPRDRRIRWSSGLLAVGPLSPYKIGFLGLANASGNWTFHGLYDPDDSILVQAEEAGSARTALYVNGSDYALVPVDDPLADMDGYYSICQYPGPLGCAGEDPPEAGASTTRDWDGRDTRLLAAFNYTCEEGFFMDEDKNQTYEEVTCIGVLGGWYPTVPYCLAYCDGDPPEAPANASYSWDGFTRVVGTEVTYTCNATGELFGNLNESLSVICSENGNWSSVSSSVFSCDTRCTDDPPEPPDNATYNWDGFASAVGTEVVYTCNDSTQFFGNLNVSIAVTCQADGSWTSLPPPLFACRTLAPATATLPPLPEGVEMVGNVSHVYWIGSTITFECEKGTETPQGTTNTTITMTEAGWSELDPDFECYPVCTDDPPEPHANADRDWDGSGRLAGTEITYTCKDAEKVFGNLNGTARVLCEADGNWTSLPLDFLRCRARENSL
ncbi:putative complement receptor type 2-like [Penaeus vannamei]|uniref:Putative complement receptor type 2-like n=1 Tax=Penaeus vannamei TaxID=6689 RepID=A0A3R7QK12_PENVA|nr:putative complement receptor type 2-like [Penaeus vannamei]